MWHRRDGTVTSRNSYGCACHGKQGNSSTCFSRHPRISAWQSIVGRLCFKRFLNLWPGTLDALHQSFSTFCARAEWYSRPDFDNQMLSAEMSFPAFNSNAEVERWKPRVFLHATRRKGYPLVISRWQNGAKVFCRRQLEMCKSKGEGQICERKE